MDMPAAQSIPCLFPVPSALCTHCPLAFVVLGKYCMALNWENTCQHSNLSDGSLASSALTLDRLSLLIPLVITAITITRESSLGCNVCMYCAVPCKFRLGCAVVNETRLEGWQSPRGR